MDGRRHAHTDNLYLAGITIAQYDALVHCGRFQIPIVRYRIVSEGSLVPQRSRFIARNGRTMSIGIIRILRYCGWSVTPHGTRLYLFAHSDQTYHRS